jgi:CO dehydrogenase maturation factor
VKTFAVSGKGGTGKTSIAALIIRRLSESVSKSVLAVDADPNVSLNELLGIKLSHTIGAIREELKDSGSTLPGGMTKQQFLEYKVQTSLVETPNFDLIAMGRPEGPGCYCYANNLLREILKTLSSNYEYVVIDNEAGMEHLSRRTAHNIDRLLLLSLPSVRAIRTAGKISRLLPELDVRVGKTHLVLNRTRGLLPQSIQNCAQEEGLNHFHSIPEDEQLFILDQEENSIQKIPVDSPVILAVDQLILKLIQNGKNDEVS